MNQEQTNLSRVKSALNNGIRLTVASALRLCNTTELRKYCSVLKREGMDIKSEWKENNGKRFKIYWKENV